jgi:hypothetical protein
MTRRARRPLPPGTGRAGLRLVALLVAIPALVAAQSVSVIRAGSAFELRYTATFSAAALKFGEQRGYDTVSLPGGRSLDQPGQPRLPAVVVGIALPAGMAVTSLRVLDATTRELPGEYRLVPAQPPERVGDPVSAADWVPPDPATYSSAAPYPAASATLIRQCDLAGQAIAVVQLSPLRYVPLTGKLVLCTTMALALEGVAGYACGDYLPQHATAADLGYYKHALASLVVNPGDVRLRTGENRAQRGVGPGEYDYVIVTTSGWVSAFQPLADWRTQKGVPANIVTTDWIYDTYAGGGNVAKLRAFVQDAYANWGTNFLLLGGDTAYVPCQDPSGTPNDTYYADFDDDWVCEVHVGRASVIDAGSGPGGISAFITKVLTFEMNPPTTNFARKVGLFGFDLTGGTPAEQYKTAIAALYMPPPWVSTRVYDSQTGNHPAAMIAAINAGQVVMNHADHCGPDFLGAGYVNHGWGLEDADIDALANGDRQGVLYSMGCEPAAYDYDACIGEHFVRNTSGGGVAFIGNSRNGYFYEGDPNSLSLLFDTYFFRSLLQENLYKLGMAFSDHKNDVMPNDALHEYLFTELTLLGDPELPIWTGPILTLTVTHPDSIAVGEFNTFVVHVNSGSNPLTGATVCLWKPGDVYLILPTDAAGTATFTFTPASAGALHVTVSKQNYVPYEGTAAAFGPGDMNCDGIVDFGDINPFVLALIDPDGYQQAHPGCYLVNADISEDGVVDFGDINPFVNCLASGTCP